MSTNIESPPYLQIAICDMDDQRQRIKGTLCEIDFSSISKYKKMDKRCRKYLNLGFLFLFLFAVLFINFFHTEKSFERDNTCPACNFQNSSLATSQINFFCLPPLSSLISPMLNLSFNYIYLSSSDSSSRSPPHI